MSSKAETSDRPPSYAEATSRDKTDDILGPVILILAGQAIYAENASTAPLYHLDRGIESLSRATTKVTFERVERIVRTNAQNEPSLRYHRRHVFDLEQTWSLYNLDPMYPVPSNCPRFFARAVSKRALGPVGLKKAFLRSSYKALPVDVDGERDRYGALVFVKDASPLFELCKKGGQWQWTDKDGNAVAIEDQGENTHRLIVTAPLQRESVDSMVALWCCRLWKESAKRLGDPAGGLQGCEFIIHLKERVILILRSQT